MKEFKYMGKTTKDGEWVNGLGIVEDYFNGSVFIARVGDPVVSHIDMIQVQPHTVCQFSGLVDKKKKDIYEGHIIKVVNHNHSARTSRQEWFEENIYEVIIKDFGMAALLTKSKMDGDWEKMPPNLVHLLPMLGNDVEIIGHVQDNPELLLVNN